MAYTTIDDPSAYFQTLIFEGNETQRTITFDGNSDLQVDLLWFKEREATANWHHFLDTTRGASTASCPRVHSNSPNAEEAITSGALVRSIGSDSVVIGTGAGVNTNGSGMVLWGWKANGGSRTTNAEVGNNPAGGYQANTTAGFSIVDYTGTGAAGTMAHGLGAVPDLIMIKNRDVADAWAVYHSANTAAPETDYLILDTDAATADDAAWWNDTAPTSSVFTVTTAHNVNADAEKYIAYCFAEIQGYSKFGGYTGNGNADGTFVYTGFKPAMIIFKRTNGTQNWGIFDNKRSTFNPVDELIYPDLVNVESGDNANKFDFLSNGFKARADGQQMNADGDTYIYIAFAEQPFVTSGGVPCTAH